jgi:hypothetical protein
MTDIDLFGQMAFIKTDPGSEALAFSDYFFIPFSTTVRTMAKNQLFGRIRLKNNKIGDCPPTGYRNLKELSLAA